MLPRKSPEHAVKSTGTSGEAAARGAYATVLGSPVEPQCDVDDCNENDVRDLNSTISG